MSVDQYQKPFNQNFYSCPWSMKLLSPRNGTFFGKKKVNSLTLALVHSIYIFLGPTFTSIVRTCSGTTAALAGTWYQALRRRALRRYQVPGTRYLAVHLPTSIFGLSICSYTHISLCQSDNPEFRTINCEMITSCLTSNIYT
jgi:hypothetical protein